MKRITTATTLFVCGVLMVVWAVSSSVAWGAAEAPAESQLLQALSASGASFTHAVNPRTGRLSMLAGANGAPLMEAPLTGAALPAEASEGAARKFLDGYGGLFGITRQAEELAVKRVTAPNAGRSFVKFRQLCGGLPVFAGELVVQVRKGAVVSVNGSVSPDCSVDAVPSVTAAKAKEAAVEVVAETHEVAASTLDVSEPELYVYNPAILGAGTSGNTLVWRIEVNAKGAAPVREVVLVNARSGHIALHFNRMCSALNRSIYDKNNNVESLLLPGTTEELKRSEGEDEDPTESADVNYAYEFAGDTYDFYYANHGRDSIDNQGMPLVSTVRYCDPQYYCPFANAGWDGIRLQMVYGDGYASADDVVGHELTHGVTQYESNLTYYGQSGAINESFSDLWGEFVDLANGKGDDSEPVRWLIGEDLSIGSVRNMQNPEYFGDPDRMTSPDFYCGTYDNGGVHWNSGVNNKAVYLMTDGGTFNGKTVTGIGPTKVAKIYYEAQAHLLTEGTQYSDLYNLLQQACGNLIGTVTTDADCTQVTNALDAVEMGQPPACGPPNLTPYQPDGWTDKIVISRGIGTNTDSTSLTTADNLYLDWAVANIGESGTTGEFFTRIYLDDVEVPRNWHADFPVDMGDWIYWVDYSLGKVSAGSHTVRIVTDTEDAIAESDETDNTYTKTITVAGTGYSLSGTVRSGSTAGAVVSGAVVSIAGKSATTSGTGTFSISDIPAGSHTLTISKSGFKTYSVPYSMTVDKSGITFALTPLYSMSGTVRSGSSTGAVVSGALVSIAGKSATTSSTGSFSISGIPAGSYTLTISKSGFKTYGATYAATTNRSGLTFLVTPLCSMSGTVRSGSTTGPVIAGAVVSIAGKSATTSSTGAFSIAGIPAGSYTLTISKSGFKAYSATYALTATRSGLTFPLTPICSMSGTVRSRSTTGPVVAGAVVSIAGKTATTSSAGTFSLTGIAAGSYTLTISKPGFKTYSATYALTASKSGLTFVLTPLYSISGTVRSGSSTGPVVAGAVVSIAGKTATTSSTGTFSLTAVPAGTYTVSISKTGYRTYAGSLAVTSNKSGLSFFLTRL